MEKYGYIRLETYDILSPRYDEAFDYYFAGESFLASKEARGFQFTKERMERIDLELKRNGIQINSEQIFLFMKEVIEGKIVFIQSADSGYDYIFSKNIGGLITRFGGANSHMAIWCAELGIPAIIGCGEKII